MIASLGVVAAAVLVLSSTAHAQTRWQVTELARIGGGDEGLASFSDIRDLQLDAKGQVWVLDFQTQTLRLFGADGSPIKEVARKGRGPGELGNTNGFRRAPDGRMFVRDHSNNRISFFAATGAAAGQQSYPSFSYGWRWEAAVDPRGRLHELTTMRRGEERERVVVRSSPDFASADTAGAPTRCTDETIPMALIRGQNGFASIPFAAQLMVGFASTGSIWCGSSADYRLRRFPFGASAHDLEITLNAPRLRIAAAVRDSAIAATEQFLVRIGGALEPWDKGDVPRDRSSMLGFHSDDQNRLWVARETPGGPTEFDVWDMTGRRIATVAPGVKLPPSPLFRVMGDRLAVVILDEDDLPTIVVYRIGRS